MKERREVAGCHDDHVVAPKKALQKGACLVTYYMFMCPAPHNSLEKGGCRRVMRTTLFVPSFLFVSETTMISIFAACG